MHSLPGSTALAMQERTSIATQDGASMRDIVEAAFRHRRLWMLVVLSVLAIALTYTAVRPREYRSEMDILVQNTRADDQITPSRVNGTIMINGVTEEQINSEIQMLQSRGLANLVVDPHWNDSSNTSLTPDQLKAHDKAVDNFEKHLTVDLVRKSNVIHATYVASNPRVATDMLEPAARGIPGQAARDCATAGNFEVLCRRGNALQERIGSGAAAVGRISAAAPDCIADRHGTEHRSRNQRCRRLSCEAPMRKSAKITQRMGTANAAAEEIPTRQTTQQRVIPNDYSVERLNTMLAELENDRTCAFDQVHP